MALSEPSIEKENNKKTTEEKLDGMTKVAFRSYGPTEIEDPILKTERGKISLNKVRNACSFMKRGSEEVDVNKS